MNNIVMVCTIDTNNTLIVYEESTEIIKTPMVAFLNELCYDNVCTYTGRLKAVREKYKIVRNPPLVLSASKKYILVPLDCINNGQIWVNYKCLDIFETREAFHEYTVTNGIEYQISIKSTQFKKRADIAYALSAQLE